MESQETTQLKRRNGYYIYKQWYLPSVTTITKTHGSAEGLLRWAAKQGGFGVQWGISRCQKISEIESLLKNPDWAAEIAIEHLESETGRTADIGRKVHGGIETFLKQINDETEYSEKELQMIQTFKDVYAEVDLDIVLVESALYSPREGFAGRVDLVADIREEHIDRLKPYLKRTSATPRPGRVIIDFKTGTVYEREHSVQISAYRQAYRDMYKYEHETAGMIWNISRDRPDQCKITYLPEERLVQSYESGFIPIYKAWRFLDAPKWWQEQAMTMDEVRDEYRSVQVCYDIFSDSGVAA